MASGKNKRGIFLHLVERNPANVKRGLILPQLPQLAPEKLGQLEPNKDDVSQLPQLAPTENNGYRAENVDFYYAQIFPFLKVSTWPLLRIASSSSAHHCASLRRSLM